MILLPQNIYSNTDQPSGLIGEDANLGGPVCPESRPGCCRKRIVALQKKIRPCIVFIAAAYLTLGASVPSCISFKAVECVNDMTSRILRMISHRIPFAPFSPSTIERTLDVWDRLKPSIILLGTIVIMSSINVPIVPIFSAALTCHQSLDALSVSMSLSNVLRVITAGLSVHQGLGIAVPVLPFYVASQLLITICTLVNNRQIIANGFKQLSEAKKNYRRSNRKLEQIAADTCSGITLVAIGILGVTSAARYGYQMIQGAHIASTLPVMEQRRILAQGALHHLPKEKFCNAVVIHGIKSGVPGIDRIYEHCNVRNYEYVESSDQFSAALTEASTHFNQPIDVLVTIGHSSPWEQSLGENYDFRGNRLEMNSIRTYLRPSDGQVIIYGCNTATEVYPMSLAAKIAEALPHTRVIGPAGYLAPLISRINFINKVFSLDSYFPFKTNAAGNDLLPTDSWNIGVTYHEGATITG